MTPRNLARLGVITLVAAAVVVVLLVKQAESDTPPESPAVTANLPKLIDLGADKCIPCKKMAPILAALREEFAGRFDVIFIDVWKDRQAAVTHKVWVIPTQIFFDADGNELFRHEGFYSRRDILGKWRELGYPFSPPQDDGAGDEAEAAAPAAEPVAARADAPAPGEVMSAPRDGVIAYYFHWTTRCQTCLEIEQYGRDVMIDSFGDELEAGRLEWHAHNMELPEHQHFQEDFDLSTPSLVLVRLEDGVIAEWKVLGKVWDLVKTPADLQDYVRAGTSAYLARAFGPG
jgi:thioredoxin 1